MRCIIMSESRGSVREPEVIALGFDGTDHLFFLLRLPSFYFFFPHLSIPSSLAD
jgi:hypothetical protein